MVLYKVTSQCLPTRIHQCIVTFYYFIAIFKPFPQPLTTAISSRAIILVFLFRLPVHLEKITTGMPPVVPYNTLGRPNVVVGMKTRHLSKWLKDWIGCSWQLQPGCSVHNRGGLADGCLATPIHHAMINICIKPVWNRRHSLEYIYTWCHLESLIKQGPEELWEFTQEPTGITAMKTSALLFQ